MPRPVCVPCNLEMVSVSNGVIVEEMRSPDEGYKVWAADSVRCPGCQATIIYRYGGEPISVHHEVSYPAWQSRATVRFWPNQQSRELSTLDRRSDT